MVVLNEKEIFQIAKKIRDYVETQYKLPVTVKLSDGSNFKVTDATYLLSSFVSKPSTSISVKSVKGASAPTGERINREVNKTNYTDMAKRCAQWIVQHGQLPNYVTILDEQKCSIILFIYCLAKIVNWYSTHDKTWPKYCAFDSRAFTRVNTTADIPSQNPVFDYFVKKFGNVNTIDESLDKVQGRGYGYYYDDKQTNKDTIDAIASPSHSDDPNCTDSCQVWYKIVQRLIQKGKYKKVDCLHVKCSGGDGHVRLRIQLNDGSYIYRDPAAVLSGKPITHNWCASNFTLLAVNPAWFLKNVDR